MKINHIEIKNYRCLKDVSVNLSKLNVMIGANGAGKTSLLEVFDIIARGSRQELSRALSDRGGVTDILSANGSQSEAFSVCFETTVPGYTDPLIYKIEIGAKGAGYVILNEVLSPSRTPGSDDPVKWIDNQPGRPKYFDQNTRGLESPNWDYDEREPMLGQVPKTNDNLERFRRLISETRFFTYLDVGKSSVVRLPQNLEPDVLLPGPNGEHMISALYNLRTYHDAVYNRILEAVRSAFPEFSALDFPLVAAGKATLIWKENGRRFYPHQMSEGTLRFLWLACLLLSPKLPPIALIDEPEVSLHPEVLQVLAGLLKEASLKSMIFVATHSDRLIRWVDLDEVLVFDKEDGVTRLVRADDQSLNMQEWLKEYTLDQLWLMGELGGRP
jgi:predicted ATPase